VIVGCSGTVLDAVGCPGIESRTPRARHLSRGGSDLPFRRSSAPSSALDAEDAGAPQVRVTHPFHPWFGQPLEFVKRRRNWRQDLVYVLDPAGRLVTLPVQWTDLAPVDPFLVVAAGRCRFTVAGLLGLADLVRRLEQDDDDGRPATDQRITP
jgi:Family of unknown function (DUF5372)